MSLPNTDPSLPSNPAPLFQDNSFVRGDQMRANNQSIWGNLEYLETTKALLGGSALQNFAALKFTGSDTTQSTSTTTGGIIGAGGLGIAKNAYIGGNGDIAGNLTVTGTINGLTLSSNGGLYGFGATGNATITDFQTDIENRTQAGYAASGVLNGPTGTTNVYTWLNLLGNNSNNTGVLAISTNLNRAYFQSQSGNVWQGWKEIITPDRGGIFTVALKTSDTTAATSTTTGSGVFGGGLGVAGAAYVGGLFRVTDTTASTSTTTGSGVFSGGLGVAGSGYFGGSINITGSGFFGSHLNVTGNYLTQLKVADSTASTSTTTGSGVFGGGLGVSGAAYFGGVCNIQGARIGIFGTNNIFFGTNAGILVTTGNDNCLFGEHAGESITTGLNNSIFGVNAGILVTSNNNTLVGNEAGISATTGANNTFLGNQAGFSINTGGNNTFLGRLAGANVTTGSNLTIIGHGVNASAANATNEVTIGPSTSTVYRMYAASWTNVSDRRDKKDIEKIPLGLDFVNDLNPVRFTWAMRDKSKVGLKDSGFIAQDFQKITKKYNADWLGLVYESNPKKLEISAGKLLPVLVKAIQELSEKIKYLESSLI